MPWASASFSPEGSGCHVRLPNLDDPPQFTGHDKRAPPKRFLGGTCLSGPLTDLGCSTPNLLPFRQGPVMNLSYKLCACGIS